MNILTVSAVVALFAIEACTASAPIQAVGARQVRVVTMTLEGGWTNGIYPNYTLSIPEDGSKISITNPMIVYSIIPSDPESNCTFVGVDGTVNHIPGDQQDIVPQAQSSVTCVAANSSFAAAPVSSAVVSSTALPVATPALTPSAANIGSSSIPPYHIAKGSSSVAGVAGVSATAVLGATNTTAGKGNSTVQPFTGNAVRAAKSIGGSPLAFVDLYAAL